MSNTKNKDTNTEKAAVEKIDSQQEDKRPICGLIMPIADTDGYPQGHWAEVKKIITSVAEECGFKTRLVSDSDDVRVIQTTIVQNVFDDDVVICDVSSKNPNVMFELGLRLAFDKAAVIIKDNITGYSFDTSPIKHINYPKDLRYYAIEEFKEDLASNLRATYNESLKKNHSMYLESFGKFVVKELKTNEVSNETYIIETLKEIKTEISNIKAKPISINNYRTSAPVNSFSLSTYMESQYKEYINNLTDPSYASAHEFYKFLVDKETETGVPSPTKEYVYKYVFRQLKTNNPT